MKNNNIKNEDDETYQISILVDFNELIEIYNFISDPCSFINPELIKKYKGKIQIRRIIKNLIPFKKEKVISEQPKKGA